MIFQKKVDRALQKLHEESDAGQDEKELMTGDEYQVERPELEKNDFLAMVIAAMITIIPAALLVLGGIVFIGYFLLMH